MLSDAQAASLHRDGFLHVPCAVPRERVERALGAINQCLGRGLDPGRMQSYRARSFCPELQKEAVITDLLYGSSAWELAESLLGRGRVKRPGTGQIALFRLEHVDHGRQKWECLTDVWREWPGMAGVAGQRTSTGNSTSSFPLRHQPSRFEQ